MKASFSDAISEEGKRWDWSENSSNMQIGSVWSSALWFSRSVHYKIWVSKIGSERSFANNFRFRFGGHSASFPLFFSWLYLLEFNRFCCAIYSLSFLYCQPQFDNPEYCGLYYILNATLAGSSRQQKNANCNSDRWPVVSMVVYSNSGGFVWDIFDILSYCPVLVLQSPPRCGYLCDSLHWLWHSF